MDAFLLCFITLLVAVDPVGILPLYVGLTEKATPARRRAIVQQSIWTATGVVLLFLMVGERVFRLLGVTLPDFMAAGGTLLFVLSMSDLLNADKRQRHADSETLGAVPLGVPLIAGPAVLTTVLLLAGHHGLAPTLAAFIINMILVALLLFYSDRVVSLIGKTGSRVASKIMALFLAAFAVMMIRSGLQMMFRTFS